MTITEMERFLAHRFAKFQPVPVPAGFRLPAETRVYTEIDADGSFVEYDAQGHVLERGLIEPVDKAEPGMVAA